MDVSFEPVYEATVSPLLVAILRGDRVSATGVASDLAAPNDQFGAPSEPEVQSVRKRTEFSDRQVFSTHVLRQDGSRPIVLDGACVWSEEIRQTSTKVENWSARQTANIYVTPHGRLVAHVFWEPGADVAARPVFRCGELHSDQDFLELMASATAPDWKVVDSETHPFKMQVSQVLQ